MKMSLTISLILLLSFSLFAENSVGKIISLEGRAFIQKENSGFKKLKINDSVENGDTLKTSNNGKIKIVFMDNSVMFVASKSQLIVEKYNYNKQNKERSSVLNLLSGRVKLLVAKLSSQKRDFKIKTKTATVGVRGTEFIVSAENENESEVLVLSGSVEVFNPLDETKKSILLSKNDIIKSIGALPITEAYRASENDFKRLNSGLNIRTMIKLKLDYNKLLKNIKLKKLLKKNKINLNLNKKNKKNKKTLRKFRRKKPLFKKGYIAPRRVRANINSTVTGD